MIFNNSESIENDIKNKITSYMTHYEYNCDDVKGLISLLRNYLYELKIKKELESYDVNRINREKFNILFTREDISYKFGISLDLELRNLKINKIISNKILD